MENVPILGAYREQGSERNILGGNGLLRRGEYENVAWRKRVLLSDGRHHREKVVFGHYELGTRRFEVMVELEDSGTGIGCGDAATRRYDSQP